MFTIDDAFGAWFDSAKYGTVVSTDTIHAMLYSCTREHSVCLPLHPHLFLSYSFPPVCSPSPSLPFSVHHSIFLQLSPLSSRSPAHLPLRPLSLSPWTPAATSTNPPPPPPPAAEHNPFDLSDLGFPLQNTSGNPQVNTAQYGVYIS